MKIDNWASYIKYANTLRNNIREKILLSKEKLDNIIKNQNTTRLYYEEIKEPFDYVDNLYIDSDVKNAVVYKTTQSILEENGYFGIGGFYNIYCKTIIISDNIHSDDFSNLFNIDSKYTIDEILCHELIHYASNMTCSSINKNVEERIAYGLSVPYLRKKGRTDDFIIRYNMMPYLVSVLNKDDIIKEYLNKNKYNKNTQCSEIFDYDKYVLKNKFINEAYRIGENIISEYKDVSFERRKKIDGKQLILEDD